ncbi:glycoprotein-N-acetylgalactosamine 3-beta-galactosyltransferase 1-like [Uranotaenia lowii]|uniref:glycoprotein-N-acetylgalactosamine 3-beta-galactosyltransferase 1-like n=1 Tax=Uranotaenia lowii TaxID=190385 RepID=UPI0024792BC0|nr:glycoprotein-N-acetylgalactosamine 3-beta-galactosyltransferase 1-like [Uranotaenia lowii]
MDGDKSSLIKRRTPISRKQLTFLLGISLACLFTLITVLQSQIGENELYATTQDKFTATGANLAENVRILCWIMTTPANHESKARHVKRTWGRRCNKLLLMSSVEDEELGTVALPVGEGREGLWNKTREAFRYVYDRHLNEYDWFMKADDDTYVIVENLRYFLYPYSPDFPIFFGSKFRYPEYVKQGYFSGGAGYVLSREALKRFVEQALLDQDHCSTAYDTEDLEMGKCMESVNVTAGDSRDFLGRKRFLPMDPVFHLTAKPDPDFWYKYYSFYEPLYGADCCSDLAISFHYIQGHQMYMMDYLIYKLRAYGVNFRQPVLPKKLRWEEANVVEGPYPAGTTTVKSADATSSSSSPSDSSKIDSIETTSINSVTEMSNESSSVDPSSSDPNKSSAEGSSSNVESDKFNIDRLLDKLLSDDVFLQKLLDKLEVRKKQ